MRELRPRHRPLKHKHQSSSVVLAGCEQLMRHVEWERLCSRARFSCSVRGLSESTTTNPHCAAVTCLASIPISAGACELTHLTMQPRIASAHDDGAGAPALALRVESRESLGHRGACICCIACHVVVGRGRRGGRGSSAAPVVQHVTHSLTRAPKMSTQHQAYP